LKHNIPWLPIATLALIWTYTLVSTPSRVIAISPPKVVSSTTLRGKDWAYTVPFAVKNVTDIEKLIQCESQGVNISRPDSDGIVSVGILQFHRGPQNTMASSTWESFSKSSGILGSPILPQDAIRQADWAISHGLGPHWTCWHIEKLALP